MPCEKLWCPPHPDLHAISYTLRIYLEKGTLGALADENLQPGFHLILPHKNLAYMAPLQSVHSFMYHTRLKASVSASSRRMDAGFSDIELLPLGMTMWENNVRSLGTRLLNNLNLDPDLQTSTALTPPQEKTCSCSGVWFVSKTGQQILQKP